MAGVLAAAQAYRPQRHPGAGHPALGGIPGRGARIAPGRSRSAGTGRPRGVRTQARDTRTQARDICTQAPGDPHAARPGCVNPGVLSCVILQRELISAEFCHRIALCYAHRLCGWQIGG
jgi:hypothetical protein